MHYFFSNRTHMCNFFIIDTIILFFALTVTIVISEVVIIVTNTRFLAYLTFVFRTVTTFITAVTNVN